jgi:membrane protease YdiL (CAAX protease family)
MLSNDIPAYNNNFNYQKQSEIKTLRKKSSGLGFFIFGYYMTMTGSVYLIYLALLLVLGDKASDITETSVPMFLLDIFASVFSAFIPALFYFLFSGNNIAETIKVKHVSFKLLIPIVFIGMAVAMLANYASDILANNFSLFGLGNTVDFNSSSSSVIQNILYIISTALVPAFAEEFAFRGVLMGTLRKYGDVFAIIVSSVMFGAMHGNISQIPFAFILGLIFAFVDCKTNSIVPSMIIHFINNFYAVALDILSNENIMTYNQYYIFYVALICTFCILGILSFIYIIKKNKNFFSINDNTGLNNNSYSSLTLKDKNKAFFINAGVIVSLSIFVIETILNLGVINV